MPNLPEKLKAALNAREQANSLRKLTAPEKLTDFSSNDYLGFSVSDEIASLTSEILKKYDAPLNGASGSRLLSGNHALFTDAEKLISEFHNSDGALLFNSGYDANIGLLSSVPQRGDLIFYDELVHASIRDGLKMSLARAYRFRHNDLADLRELVSRNRRKFPDAVVYIVTEAVFSMDGDMPDLLKLSELAEENRALLIIDEAHSTGVTSAEGVVQQQGLHQNIFARIITYGKAFGCHGAAVLGSEDLMLYLVNFARSFIYTTALPPHTVAGIMSAYEHLKYPGSNELIRLHKNIGVFRSVIRERGLEKDFIESNSAIQCCVISGNKRVRLISAKLKEEGYEVKAILSPTVPAGRERLRFCLHSYNSRDEIKKVLDLLADLIGAKAGIKS